MRSPQLEKQFNLQQVMCFQHQVATTGPTVGRQTTEFCTGVILLGPNVKEFLEIPINVVRSEMTWLRNHADP
jgi:hypothetical protein